MKKLLLSLLLLISNYTFTQEVICDLDEIILQQIRKEADLSQEFENAEWKKEYEQADENTKLNYFHGMENANSGKIDENNNPTLYKIINDLSKKMDVKIRNTGIIFEDTPLIGISKANACAIRNNFLIGIDFLKNLNLNEIKAILAHEMAHIKLQHYFKLKKFASKTSLIPFAALILTHLFARKNQFYQNHKYKILIGAMYSYVQLFFLAYMKLSRAHEYEADCEAIKHLNKDDLKNALRKIASTNNWNWLIGIFRTHPTLNKRLQYIDQQ